MFARCPCDHRAPPWLLYRSPPAVASLTANLHDLFSYARHGWIIMKNECVNDDARHRWNEDRSPLFRNGPCVQRRMCPAAARQQNGDRQNEVKALVDVKKWCLWKDGSRVERFSDRISSTCGTGGRVPRRIEKCYSRPLPRLHISWTHRRMREDRIFPVCFFLLSTDTPRVCARVRV